MTEQRQIVEVSKRLDALPKCVSGQVEAMFNFPEPPTPERLEDIKETARNSGWIPDEESMEIEGRHTLALTWRF